MAQRNGEQLSHDCKGHRAGSSTDSRIGRSRPSARLSRVGAQVDRQAVRRSFGPYKGSRSFRHGSNASDADDWRAAASTAGSSVSQPSDRSPQFPSQVDNQRVSGKCQLGSDRDPRLQGVPNLAAASERWQKVRIGSQAGQPGDGTREACVQQEKSHLQLAHAADKLQEQLVSDSGRQTTNSGHGSTNLKLSRSQVAHRVKASGTESQASCSGGVNSRQLLSLDSIDMDCVYQGIVYSAHDVHGFFVRFGTLTVSPRSGVHDEFRTFPVHGRITRSGLPELWQRRCQELIAHSRSQSHHIDVTVKSLDQDQDKVRIELMLVPPRKLLILDVNGVLFNRYAVGDERRGHQEQQLRPGCLPFLDFCFAQFDVACWSCCRKETLENELTLFGDHKDHLMFAHYGVHSSNLWPRHSVVSPDKPLFLKYLPHLWKRFDRVVYNQTNTILIDNHAEKFEGNPPGTCILLPEYLDNSQPPDTVLSPDGELKFHLGHLAAAPDSSAYISCTQSAFFPHTYPEPPVDEGPRCREEILEAYCGSRYMREQRPDLTADFYIERQQTPGPRALQLRRRTLHDITHPNHPHVVCEKSDGIRLFLFVPHARSAVFLIDRRWRAEALDYQLSQLLSPMNGLTLLDGELIEPLSGTSAPAQLLYLIFDVIFLDGQDVGELPSLRERMSRIEARLAQMGPEQTTVAFGETRPRNRLSLVAKKFHDLNDLGQLMKQITPRNISSELRGPGAAEELVYDNHVRRTLTDGLVFTPSMQPYYAYQVQKFKLPSRISIDFRVRVGDLQKRPKQQQTIQLYLCTNKLDMKFSNLDASRQVHMTHPGVDEEGSSMTTGQYLRDYMETHGTAEVVVECDFCKTTGAWILRTVRADKSHPNSLQTAWNNLEAIAEHLTLDTLCQKVHEQLRAAEAMTEPLVAAVASHYDSMQKRRWDSQRQAKDPRIENLRRLNNWIKSVFIEATLKGHLPPDQSLREKTLSSHSPGQDPNPLPSREARDHIIEAAETSTRNTQAFSVLDLACGRGADVGKFDMQGCHCYVGVDISPASVIECRSRVCNKQNGPGRPQPTKKVGVVLTASMIDPELPCRVQEAWKKAGHGELTLIRFDVISCQFALHYACDTEQHLRSMLLNVVELLSPDGLFLVSTMDSRMVQEKLSKARHTASPAEFGNAIYRLRFMAETESSALKALGCKYSFSLSSAVEDCDEYVVPVELLRDLAGELGLHLVYHENFGRFANHSLGRYGQLLSPLHVEVVSEEEWEVTCMYCLMLFRRKS